MLEADYHDYQVFRRRGDVTGQAIGYICGGIAFLGILGLNFVAMIHRPAKPGDNAIPGIIGGVSVIGIALIARGLFLLRTTVEVALDPAGVHIRSLLKRRSIAWSEITRLERDKRSSLMGGGTHDVARLLDAAGKPLAEIADTIDDFELLASEITRRCAEAAGRIIHDPQTDELDHIARDARRIKWVALAMGFFTVAMGAGFVAGLNEEFHNRRFATEGVQVNAKIDRRWMVRVTPYIEFHFTDERGSVHSREAMMFSEPYARLLGKNTVPVLYLRSDPEHNRLVEGEDKSSFGGTFLTGHRRRCVDVRHVFRLYVDGL